MPKSSKDESGDQTRAGAPQAEHSRPVDGIYPAYGHMNRPWMFDVRSRRVPGGFMVKGRPGTAEEWRDYLEHETKGLSDFLWPLYDPFTQCWTGKAVATMDDLTRADLAIMAVLAGQLEQAPEVDGEPLKATHQHLFEVEDETPPGGSTLYPSLDIYLPDMPADSIAALKSSIKKMSVEFGPAPLRFKEYMQRPRPFQVAFALGEKFTYEFGHTAVSPALPSGHCMQGLVRHAAAFIAHRDLIARHPKAGIAFAQHAVDYGDRRVFAGVHFPSDNIASWFLSLRLCDVLYGHIGQDAKSFMWAAIQRSFIYRALREQASKKDSKSAFATPLKILADEAKRDAHRPPG